MRAVINEDMIVALTSSGPVEIGRLPAGVGLDRLRWDGANIVDLAALTEIQVRHISGVWELHALPVPGSQPVAMTWADRRNLVMVDGVIRVKTAEELAAETAIAYNGRMKTVLRGHLQAAIGDTGDQIADINKMAYLLAEAVCGDATALAALQELVVAMRGIYQLAEAKAKLADNAAALQVLIPPYYVAKI